jgi:hypothetical protein
MRVSWRFVVWPHCQFGMTQIPNALALLGHGFGGPNKVAPDAPME